MADRRLDGENLPAGARTRVRRGIVVVIPPKWEGKVTTPATIRQRPSKMRGKLKRLQKPNVRYKDARDVPLEAE